MVASLLRPQLAAFPGTKTVRLTFHKDERAKLERLSLFLFASLRLRQVTGNQTG
jgi:hypothetical protein